MKDKEIIIYLMTAQSRLHICDPERKAIFEAKKAIKDRALLVDELECAIRGFDHLKEALQWLHIESGWPGSWGENQMGVIKTRIENAEIAIKKVKGGCDERS